jgi:hypothetical protein
MPDSNESNVSHSNGGDKPILYHRGQYFAHLRLTDWTALRQASAGAMAVAPSGPISLDLIFKTRSVLLIQNE